MDPFLSQDTIESTRGSFYRPLQSRNFVALWGGQTFSQFGDSILWVALPLTVYSMTGSTLQMGFVMAFLMIPQVLLLPFTGIVVDRMSRSRLMILTDLLRFLLVAGLTAMAAQHWLSVPRLEVFVLCFGALDALFQPAYSAARAQVFTPDIRNAANGLTQISQQGARVLGPSIGGIAIGFFSVTAGFAIDAITLAVSVTSLIFLRLNPLDRATALTAPRGIAGFVHELAGGVRELRKFPWLWITIMAFAFVNISGTGIATILLPWLIKVHLGLSGTVYGVVSSAAGVGAIVCAIIYGRKRRWHHRGLAAYVGVGISALAEFSLAFTSTPLEMMVLIALSSAGIMVFALTWEGSLQELVAPTAYGRVSSLDSFGSFALLPVGNVLTGWLATKIGGIGTIKAESLVSLLVVLVVLGIPAIRRFD